MKSRQTELSLLGPARRCIRCRHEFNGRSALCPDCVLSPRTRDVDVVPVATRRSPGGPIRWVDGEHANVCLSPRVFAGG